MPRVHITGFVDRKMGCDATRVCVCVVVAVVAAVVVVVVVVATLLLFVRSPTSRSRFVVLY